MGTSRSRRVSRCWWGCARCSPESRLPLPRSTRAPCSPPGPEKRPSAAVNCEPSHLSMAAVGSLRREGRNKSPGTHELFTAVLSKQSAIIYLFSPTGLRLRAQRAGEGCQGCPRPAPPPWGATGHPGASQHVADAPWGCWRAVLAWEGKKKPSPFLVLMFSPALAGRSCAQGHKKEENHTAEGESVLPGKEMCRRSPLHAKRIHSWFGREGILCRHTGQGWETGCFGSCGSCFPSLDSTCLSVEWGFQLRRVFGERRLVACPLHADDEDVRCVRGHFFSLKNQSLPSRD